MNNLPVPRHSSSTSNGSLKAKDEESRVSMTTSPSGLSASKHKETMVTVQNPDKGCYFSRTQVAAFMFAFILTMCVVVILVTCFGHSARSNFNTDRPIGGLDIKCDCSAPYLAQSEHEADNNESNSTIKENLNINEQTIDEVETVTSDSEESEIGIRLPGDILPIHYDLDLDLRVEGEYSRYTGRVKIIANITQNTSLVVFHVKPYNFLEVFEEEVYIYQPKDYISDKDLDKIRVPIVNYYKDAHKEIHAARLKEPLLAGTNYIIYIRKFRGLIIGDLKGLYMSSYKDSNGEKR